MLGIWLSITSFTFHFLLIHLLKHFNYFLDNEICLERYFSHLQSMYYLEFHAKLATEQKLRGVSTRHPVSEALLLETCLEYPFGHHNLYPETEAFGWPKIHFYESSWLIRILPKTGECLGSLYGSSESLADDLTCIPRIPYISMKLCINMRPSLLQIIIFLHLKRRSQTENNIESIHSVSRH